MSKKILSSPGLPKAARVFAIDVELRAATGAAIERVAFVANIGHLLRKQVISRSSSKGSWAPFAAGVFGFFSAAFLTLRARLVANFKLSNDEQVSDDHFHLITPSGGSCYCSWWYQVIDLDGAKS